MSDIPETRRSSTWKVEMGRRSPDETHRAATPLEWFFDLVFVVAIARASGSLEHEIIAGHPGRAVIGYVVVFFAIWWAWMNFTWFASAYDNDDVPYRLAVFVQSVGALILAAGVPEVVEHGNFAITTMGYVVMRLAMVAQWLRAAHDDPYGRPAAVRFAIGIAALQVAWVALLSVPEPFNWIGFAVFGIGELIVPAWAERAAPTSWHPDHIVERYGLFTIIVLGESVLAGTVAIGAAVESGDYPAGLVEVMVGGVLIVLSMWWIYFDLADQTVLDSLWKAFLWGYGHYAIFAGAAAVGAGLVVSVERATHQAGAAAVTSLTAGLAVTIPVAVYLVALWVVRDVAARRQMADPLLVLGAATAVLATAFTGHAALLTGLIISGLVTYKVIRRERRPPT
jgi:low temperature requirement protein LtrA